MAAPTSPPRPSLASLEQTLPRACYVEAEFFARESERIFATQWFCVARESELPDPGSHLVVSLAGESVLVVRDTQGRLHAHFNVCRHRGSQLVPADLQGCERASGRFDRSIRCPYHAWTYALDGALERTPHLDDPGGHARRGLGLHAVACDVWGGFVFLNLAGAGAAKSLAQQLGPVPDRLQRYPLEALRTGRRIEYRVAANWKVVLENYNECYHCSGVHPELCRIVPAFRENGGASLDWDRGIPHRPGATTFTFSGVTDRAPFPGLDEDERTRHKGELVFPNLMLSLAADHVAAFTVWPAGPELTDVACDFLFHPDEIARAGFDPSDAVDFWDLVNRQDWTICESVQRGMRSRVFTTGLYAPMESMSLDVRRYLTEHLGEF